VGRRVKAIPEKPQKNGKPLGEKGVTRLFHSIPPVSQGGCERSKQGGAQGQAFRMFLQPVLTIKKINHPHRINGVSGLSLTLNNNWSKIKHYVLLIQDMPTAFPSNPAMSVAIFGESQIKHLNLSVPA